MKKEIHPEYHTKVKATCACGHTFNLASTMDKIEVEVCSNCHPFYTGEARVIDTAGRVEKFKIRRETAKKKKAERSKLAEEKAKKNATKKTKAKKDKE